ncbi:MAG: FAD-dependent oxidoreductase [Candidatus Saccharibacteria bacterium]|nr:FAD-dependent oxidoreductase [Candidatus Saccharibacteria bacterium]
MNVVVVGSGFGGVKLALELSNKSGVKVTLVSKISNFEYHAALYRSGTGRSPLEVVLPLRTIFKRSRNVTIEQDRIVGIDTKKKHVVSETGHTYKYDKVVFAMGNKVNYFGISGLEESTMTLDTIANTIALRHELTDVFKKKKRPKVAVIGAGPAGVELVGELQHYADMVAEKYQLRPPHVQATIIEGANRLLPALDEKASKKALKRLRQLKVRVKLGTQVDSCVPGKVCISSGDIKADVIVWTAGSRAVGFYAEHPEVFELERGRVRVDQYLHAVGHEDIYVIGDNAATPHSGMAQTALHDATFVAENILREQRRERPKWYRSITPIYAVPIGPKWAILQTKTKVISGYKAWLARRRADLAIYRNFQPYKQAVKTWRKGNKPAKF